MEYQDRVHKALRELKPQPSLSEFYLYQSGYYTEKWFDMEEMVDPKRIELFIQCFVSFLQTEEYRTADYILEMNDSKTKIRKVRK